MKRSGYDQNKLTSVKREIPYLYELKKKPDPTKWCICEKFVQQRNLNVNKNLLLSITRFDGEKSLPWQIKA